MSWMLPGVGEQHVFQQRLREEEFIYLVFTVFRLAGEHSELNRGLVSEEAHEDK